MGIDAILVTDFFTHFQVLLEPALDVTVTESPVEKIFVLHKISVFPEKSHEVFIAQLLRFVGKDDKKSFTKEEKASR